jgi:hypothetical protein
LPLAPSILLTLPHQVKLAPRAVDEKDDKLLSNLMSTLEAQNQEIDGDEEEEVRIPQGEEEEEERLHAGRRGRMR